MIRAAAAGKQSTCRAEPVNINSATQPLRRRSTHGSSLGVVCRVVSTLVLVFALVLLDRSRWRSLDDTASITTNQLNVKVGDKAMISSTNTGSVTTSTASKVIAGSVLSNTTGTRTIPTASQGQNRRDNTAVFFYGTNKLNQHTLPSVKQAIQAGIRHIATGGATHAHHNETAVGIAWTEAAKELKLSREDFFIQTMVVAPSNPDYNKADNNNNRNNNSTITQQIRATIQDSLNNLQTSYLDAVLYHNFKSKLDPVDDVLEAWRELERLAIDEKKIRQLGFTNVHDPSFLLKIHDEARIKPTILQNRFHKNKQFNIPMRNLLKEKKISWQAFWILTGNFGTVSGPVGKELAQKRNLTPPQFMYAFILSLGATPLIGAKTLQHVNEDLHIQKRIQEEGIGAFFAGQAGQRDRIAFAKALGRPDLVEE